MLIPMGRGLRHPTRAQTRGQLEPARQSRRGSCSCWSSASTRAPTASTFGPDQRGREPRR
jgi:hypothetical protein